MKKITYIIIIVCIVIAMFVGIVVVAKNSEQVVNNNINEVLKDEKNNLNEISNNNNITNSIETSNSQNKENMPLSNSNAPAGEIIFKKFDVKSNEIELLLEEWEIKEDNLYYKKFTDYQEYRKLTDNYSELRKMTETDFENYFPVIILTTDTNKRLQYRGMDNTNIIIEYTENEDKNLQYSGIVIIMPNMIYNNSTIELEVKSK